MMSGNGPSVDYRMLGMAGSVFPGRMPGFDSNQYGNDMNVDADQQSTENDDLHGHPARNRDPQFRNH